MRATHIDGSARVISGKSGAVVVVWSRRPRPRSASGSVVRTEMASRCIPQARSILDWMELAAVCERYRAGFLGQPANAVTSIAFVVAGAGILVASRRSGTHGDTPVGDRRTVFALLVACVGLGSFIQHGPHPEWQAYAHDVPLAAVLVFVATDAVSDLTGRELSQAWWLVPSVAMVPVVASGATASTIVQAMMAGAAIGLNLLRAKRRPALRKTVIAALVTAAAGAAIGPLTDRTSLTLADGLVQGHAVWHVLAAAALWRLAPAIGARRRSSVIRL
jgi:hypothetical protein